MMCLLYLVNTMAADNLATQGTMASADGSAIFLPEYSRLSTTSVIFILLLSVYTQIHFGVKKVTKLVG